MTAPDPSSGGLTEAEVLAAFRAECDKVGIPYGAAGLVRHHRNNAAAVEQMRCVVRVADARRDAWDAAAKWVDENDPGWGESVREANPYRAALDPVTPTEAGEGT